jgi:hypothetical protein
MQGNMRLVLAREPGDFAPPSVAEVAWTETSAAPAKGPSRKRKRGSPASVQYVTLYRMQWDNPRPDVEIASIDIVSSDEAIRQPSADGLPPKSLGAPAILAITTGCKLQDLR